MFDAMNLADLAEHHVELLPARTALSLWRAGIDGLPGAPGDPGTRGADGQSFSGTTMSGTTMWQLITGSNQSDPGTSASDASSKHG